VQSLTDSLLPLKYLCLELCGADFLKGKVCGDPSSSHAICEVRSQDEAPLNVDSSDETSITAEERGGRDTKCFTYAPVGIIFTRLAYEHQPQTLVLTTMQRS